MKPLLAAPLLPAPMLLAQAAAATADVPPWLWPLVVGATLGLISWLLKREVDAAERRIGALEQAQRDAQRDLATRLDALQRDLSGRIEAASVSARDEAKATRHDLANRVQQIALETATLCARYDAQEKRCAERDCSGR